MSVSLLILNTGEHILCENYEDSGHTYHVDTPVSMVPDPRQQGRMMFMPYLQFSEETSCAFPKSEVRHVLKPKAELANAYNAQFGSGIQVPPKELILG